MLFCESFVGAAMFYPQFPSLHPGLSTTLMRTSIKRNNLVAVPAVVLRISVSKCHSFCSIFLTIFTHYIPYISKKTYNKTEYYYGVNFKKFWLNKSSRNQCVRTLPLSLDKLAFSLPHCCLVYFVKFILQYTHLFPVKLTHNWLYLFDLDVSICWQTIKVYVCAKKLQICKSFQCQF